MNRIRVAVARWQALDVLVRDGVLVLALAPLMYAPQTAKIGAEFGDLSLRRYDLLGVVLVLALWLPLVARRRWPGWCLTIVASAFAAHELLGYPLTFATAGLYVALASAGAHQTGRWRGVTVVGTSVGYVGFAVGLHTRESPQGFADFLLIYLVLVVCWGVGTGMRARQVAEAGRRRRSVESAVTQERARIARELHDVVTHHVTAMVVQADAAQFVLRAAPDRVATGLGAISDSGRRALIDLQHLLGVLNASSGASETSADRPSDEAPDQASNQASERGHTPTLGSLSDVVEHTRAAGQPVELTEQGERRQLAAGVELAAYRVVQESLTNAIKHAPGRHTGVRVSYRPDEIEVEVVTQGSPTGATASSTFSTFRSSGRGLVGLRERVSVFGGELVAGERPDGDFGVWARIPSAVSIPPGGDR